MPGFITGEEGYDVLIRKGEKRGDKFKVAIKNLPRNKALRQGKEAVDNFIEATYRIQKSGKTTTELDDPRPPDLRKFRRPKPKSKLPRDSLIERVRHRIDSIGEKRQLSFFKEQARKKKQALQSQISFLQTQQKKQQLQSAIATTQAQEVSFIQSSKQQSNPFGFSKKVNGKLPGAIKFI